MAGGDYLKVRMQEPIKKNDLPRLEHQMYTTAFAFSRRHSLGKQLVHIILKVPMIVYAYFSCLSAIGMFIISDDVLKQIFLAASAIATLALTIFKFIRDAVNERKQKRLAKQLQLAEFKIDEMEHDNKMLQQTNADLEEERLAFRREIRAQIKQSQHDVEELRHELDEMHNHLKDGK